MARLSCGRPLLNWYVDASLIIPTLVVETASDPAVDWFAAHDTAEFFISAWVETEVASALAMKRRMGMLDAAKTNAAENRFDIMASTLFSFAPISTASFRDAASIVRTTGTGVRAADALHLAVARRSALGIATCDRVMHATALELKMTTALIASE